MLCFSGRLGIPRAKNAFKDSFLHHPVGIMSMLSVGKMNEEDPFMNTPFLDQLSKCGEMR